VLDEVPKDPRAWRPQCKVIDVSVQGLLHSKDELGHGAKSPPQAEFPAFTI
jgi:hypothetical protein